MTILIRYHNGAIVALFSGLAIRQKGIHASYCQANKPPIAGEIIDSRRGIYCYRFPKPVSFLTIF